MTIDTIYVKVINTVHCAVFASWLVDGTSRTSIGRLIIVTGCPDCSAESRAMSGAEIGFSKLNLVLVLDSVLGVGPDILYSGKDKKARSFAQGT